MRLKCAECNCIVDGGVRVVRCAEEDCCCAQVPLASDAVVADP